MKTKAYKLAAELRLPEASLLEWLRAHGYPNARRADTIRAEVVKAARRDLGPRRGAPPRSARGYDGGRRTQPPRQSTPPGPRPPGGSAKNPPGLKMSFAELLQEHLPEDQTAGAAPSPERHPSPAAPSPSVTQKHQDELERAKVHSANAGIERDNARRACQVLQDRLAAEKGAREAAEARLISAAARTEGLEHTLAQAQAGLETLGALREDVAHLRLERATLRRAVQSAIDEQSSLESTCSDLQRALAEAHRALEHLESTRADHSGMVSELESAMKREMAWRTRALELERTAQQGGNLPGLLQDLGLEGFQVQAQVLVALLSARDTALPLLRAIRQVDHTVLTKLVANRVTRVCANPLCNQVVQQDGRIALPLDDDRGCEICAGNSARRWFARMVKECQRAGIRRLLVIGGAEETCTELRMLSQGQPVDLRLISADEAAHLPRVRGRVEGCDALVLWSTQVLPPAHSEPYRRAAHAARRVVVSVLGETCGAVPFSRAVSYRLARNHVLTPD